MAMDSNWIIKTLSKNRTWTVVSAIAAMVSALCAAYAVQQTRATLQQQRDAGCPYFALENPHIEETSKGKNEYELKIPLKNVGVRPAARLQVRLIAVKQLDADKVDLQKDYSSFNDIPTGQSPTIRPMTITFQSLDTGKLYFVVRAKYDDPVTKQDSMQFFYMTWEGLREGKGSTGLAHANQDEAEALARKFKGLLRD